MSSATAKTKHPTTTVRRQQDSSRHRQGNEGFFSFIDRKAWIVSLMIVWVIVMMTVAFWLTLKLALIDSTQQELETPLMASENVVNPTGRQISKLRRLPTSYRNSNMSQASQ